MSRRISWGALAVTFAALAGLGSNAWADPRAPREDRRSPPPEEPSRVREWVWMNGNVGVQAIDLRTFNADIDRLTVGFVHSNAVGPAADIGLGVRFVVVTLGARARFATFEDDSAGAWNTWSLDGELGFHVPLGRLEPYLTLGGGYTALGDLDHAVQGLREPLDVSGANARVGLGLDYYVTPRVTIGASANLEAVALTRPGVPLADLAEAKKVGTLNEAQSRILEADGSSWGTAMTFAGGAGVHF